MSKHSPRVCESPHSRVGGEVAEPGKRAPAVDGEPRSFRALGGRRQGFRRCLIHRSCGPLTAGCIRTVGPDAVAQISDFWLKNEKSVAQDCIAQT